MRRKSLIVMITLVIIVGAVLNFSGASLSLSKKIVQGVQAGGVDLGGLTREEAMRKLEVLAGDIQQLSVSFCYGDKTWQADAGSLGLSLNSEQTIEKALRVGHTGTLINQWRQRQTVKNKGMDVPPVLSIDDRLMQKTVQAMAGEIIAQPVNAGFKITDDDRVEIVPGRVGSAINFDALKKQIMQGVTSDSRSVEVVLPLVAVAPQRSTEDIQSMGVDGLIARYSTRFDAGQVGRTYNIKVASAALDGLLLAPGEVFSFNRVVGPRSSEAGYKNANVIINNELVEGLGGGVCQVSSTLYNAVLLANLKVIDRSNHSLPVGYVPVGRDATVSYGAIDFRFVNNKEHYIYLKSFVEGNTLTIKVYGNRATTPRVEVSSWVTEEIEPRVVYEKDPNLAAGEQVVKQKGNKGFRAVTVRYVWEDGQKVTEQLPASYYHAVNRIVALGTGAVKPTVVTPPDEKLAMPGTGTSQEDPAGTTNGSEPGGVSEPEGEQLPPETGGQEDQPAPVDVENSENEDNEFAPGENGEDTQVSPAPER